MEGLHLKDRVFYKTLLSIALPIAMQNLISSALNMVDTLMIGQLGASSIAAVGQANQVFFQFVLIMFGINSSCAIFTAQFWGKKDVLNIRKVLGLSLITGSIVSITFTLSAFFAPRFILSLFIKDPVVIELGSQYLRVVSISYLFTTISFAYSFGCRSIGQAKLPMVISAIALLTNTALNYVLIFGKFGFPEMGVRGAALATVIARIVETILVLIIIYSKRGVLAGSLKDMFSLSMSFVKRVFKTGLPVIANEAFWALGMIMYTVAFGRISTEAVASVHIANTVQNIFMVVAFGMGNACATMLGHEIGAGNKERTYSYAITFSILGTGVGILLGAGLIVASPLILSLFNITPEVYRASKIVLIISGLLMAVRIFNTQLIIGILRSGGDTTFSLLLEMGGVWGVGVPLAFLGALVFKLPVYWVYALLALEEITKAALGLPRVLSKKWIKSVVEHM
ncbi:MAG: MATE family efflux transporter [Bacillota bacterium]